MENKFNLVGLVDEMSKAISENNPQLKDLVSLVMNSNMRNEEDILNYLCKKYPEKEDEIRDNYDVKAVKEMLDKINTAKDGLLKFTF